MTKRLMIQGTMSGVGKSLLTAALCRIFWQDGYRVAPFKSQNMALNSYITENGLEMGRAQVLQAWAAGREPDVRMNPILLKPSSDVGSQLIVKGEVRGDYQASEYFRKKRELIPEILASYHSLCQENDILVIEGAGSPAEINLKADDIVNMGLARLVDAPVLLVGDIDRGGVFAQLYGTLALLEPDEQDRVVGCVINKFRGDVTLLQPGLKMLEEKTKVPVLGVIPYVPLDLDEEDSLAPCLTRTSHHKPVDLAVIRLPRLSNFTDFAPLERHEALGVRYVSRVEELGRPDGVLLPGTKNTMGDLLWLRQNGLEAELKKLAAQGTPLLGICGGYQMLGRSLSDPDGVEEGGTLAGMGLLPCDTVFFRRKIRRRTRAKVVAPTLAGGNLAGYEIHMGETTVHGAPFCRLDGGKPEGAVQGNVFGTYLHGLFDTGELTERLAQWLLSRKGLAGETGGLQSHRAHQEEQLNQLACIVRQHIDLPAIYEAMEQNGRGER